ncbi:MAG: SCO family protein [Parvularculaceae bacterium]|nr:SCO family protein [Parvularculaceae bacterium]
MGKLWKTVLAPALLALGLAACDAGPSVDVPKDAVVKLSDAFSSDFDLVDTSGAKVSDENFRGKVMAVYFGFATCPDVCPMALSRLSGALSILSEKERSQLAPVFITVDPERDTPDALKAFLAFDDRIIGLTGSREAVDRARASFKVYAKKAALPGSALGYTMDHSSLFYIVDRDGRVTLALHDFLKPDEFAEMLRRSIHRRN